MSDGWKDHWDEGKNEGCDKILVENNNRRTLDSWKEGWKNRTMDDIKDYLRVLMTDHLMVEIIAGKMAKNLVEIRGLTIVIMKD